MLMRAGYNPIAVITVWWKRAPSGRWNALHLEMATLKCVFCFSGGRQILSEEGYWGSSPCSSESPNGGDGTPTSTNLTHQAASPFHQYASIYYPPPEQHEPAYDEGYYGASSTNLVQMPFVRVIKRRTTANKKERRRTQSINSAFTNLRDCIPNVPLDTKLSKIKTLRLATSYITYLTRVLEGDQDPSGGFRAELVPSSRKINAERRAKMEAQVSLVFFYQFSIRFPLAICVSFELPSRFTSRANNDESITEPFPQRRSLPRLNALKHNLPAK